MGTAGRISLLLVFGTLLLASTLSASKTSAQENRPREGRPVAEDLEAGQRQPFDLGLREETGVAILMLDVKVRDKKGRPVHGLTLEDFEVTINGRLWPLAAVDDFCDCNGSPDPDSPERAGGKKSMESSESSRAARGVIVEAGTDEISGAAAGGAAPPVTSLPQHFVIYLEFSELQHTGRLEAERQARRWIEESMQPGDRVMLAGFSTATGLVEITPFTTHEATLLKGLEEAFADKAFIDPFPMFLLDRLRDWPRCFKWCIEDGSLPETCYMSCCLAYARDEAGQGRRALEALELFITSLEGIPGRKQILYFNQNNLIYPERLYLPVNSHLAFSITDHLQLMERVAATAMASRTAINVATMPFLAGIRTGLGDLVVALGSNLSDFSGGIASRTLYDLPTTLGKAGRECCMYRLSVQVPDDPPRRTLRATVAVRGRTLGLNYRVRFYTTQERWFRQARLALMTTSRSPDSRMQVALLPVARREGKWSVDAQVAFALQDLELVPRMEDRTGRWRVGALLNREDGDEVWEMLTLARATLQGKGSTRLEALHSRMIENLKPGSYRLRAFVEDAELGRFWSREVTLDLPDPGKNPGEKPWLSIPVVSRRIHGRLDLDLAPVTKKPPVSSVVGDLASGFIPMNEVNVAAGAILEIRTLLCPVPDGDERPSTVSILLKDDRPLVRLPAAIVEQAGDCGALTDTVDTSALTPGEYTYRLMLKHHEKEDPLMRDVAVTIRPASSL
ncbi:MAG: hypothetical protein E2P00_00175 [Acidobacteria bacterium]|nr:MAG: hypothetical protein E2P00_00175 [Acidobacteriota bacterium]